MGQLAQDIHNEATARVPAAPVTNPADLMDGPDLLAVFAKVEQAIAVLELLTRGARILHTPAVPDDGADGEDGDLAINLATTDLYAKDAGHWQVLFRLKGDKGDNVKGDPGLSAYQVAKVNGFLGTEVQWLASLGKAGNDGKSAYQVAQANGFVGTVGQWLDSLKVQGDAGQRGNVNRWQSYAPTTEDGLVGDLWIYSISATKCAFYKCTASLNGVGTWSLRFTSPDAATSTSTGPSYSLPQATAGLLGGIKLGVGLTYNSTTDRVDASGGSGTVKSVNGQAPDAAGNVNVGQQFAWDYQLGNVANPPAIDFRKTTVVALVGKSVGLASASYSVVSAAGIATTPTPLVFTNGLDQRGIQVPAGGQLVFSQVIYTQGYSQATLFLEGTQS